MPNQSVAQKEKHSMRPIEEEKRAYMYGNEVVVWAALAAGAE